MRAFVLSLLLATAAIAPAAAQMVAPPKPARVAENFLPHRATYDLKLKSARWASAVSGLSGRMVSEFDDVCAGYTFNQRLVTDFTDSEGTATSGNFWVSTYESADGSDYRFTLNNAINGISVERSQGSASRKSDGAASVAFTQPAAKSAELPQGTLFPTELAGKVLTAARTGQHALSAKIFEGDAEGVTYDVYAAIGVERAGIAGDFAVPGGDVLKGLKAWPVTVTYYEPGKEDEPPHYETSFILYENGVTSDATLDYGDFVLKATLKKIEPLKPSGC